MTSADSFVRLPVVSLERVESTLLEVWGVTGRVTALDGERDLNFRIDGVRDGDPGIWMFKISNVAENPLMLTCQALAFDRLMDLDGLDFPSVVPSLSGNEVETLPGSDGSLHLCRLTCWVPGSLWSSVQQRNADLYRSLGTCLAEVDNALHGFQHPGLNRPLPWDIRNAVGVIDTHLSLVEGAGQRKLILHFRRLHDERLLPVSAILRSGTIHNDANDNTILVSNAADGTFRVSGLIDFGDMIRGWLVAELAIACAYAVLDDPEPLAAAADVTAGYHQNLPLLSEEAGVLFTLIGLRMCQSVLLALHHQRLDPDNVYLSVSMEASWRLLNELTRWEEGEASALFKQVCGHR